MGREHSDGPQSREDRPGAAGINVRARTLAPRGVQDHRSIADEAARLYLREEPPPLSIRDIAGLLKVNQVTVSKPLDHWYAAQGLTRPDGRSVRKARVAPATPVRRASRPCRPRRRCRFGLSLAGGAGRGPIRAAGRPGRCRDADAA